MSDPVYTSTFRQHIFAPEAFLFRRWQVSSCFHAQSVIVCLILSEASRVYGQLEVILAWKYRESVLVEFSRYYLTICSCVVDIGVGPRPSNAAQYRF